MTPALVWDCSAAMAMAFEDERDDYACGALRVVRHQGAIVPAHWPMEVVSVLRVAERRNRIDPASSREFLALLAALPVRIEGCSNADGVLTELYDSAERFALTSYDAAYLRLALKTSLPLASKDGELNAAARRAGVALFA